MTLLLTDLQRDYLRRAPVDQAQANKIRLAVRLADTNISAAATALQLPYQQLNRYVAGGDLLLSTSWLIASAFGVTPCDLWPVPPVAKRRTEAAATRGMRRSASKRKTAKRGPKAEAA